MISLETARKKALRDWEVLDNNKIPIIYIGTATCGRAAGAMKVLDSVQQTLKEHNLNKKNQHEQNQYFSTLADRDEQRLSENRQQLFFWLKRLKEEWKNLDRERIAAAEERMRLLGHID